MSHADPRKGRSILGQGNRARLAAPAVLIILPLVLYARFLFGGRVLYWGVYLLQFYPWRQLAVEQIRSGHWPLWNPYLGAGTPLAANLQTAAFYPLNALFLLMPVERAFGWELALHVMLAGLFAYYLGRALGMDRFGALITGLTYGMGGYLVARWVFPSMVYAIAWLPLLLALTEKIVSRPRVKAHTWRYTALLALTIALQLLAGHAQTSFYSLLIMATFALWRAYQERRNGIVRSAWPVTPALLWGLALAAIQLLPTAELTAHSQRAGTLSDLQFAQELSFWPWRLITLLAPDFFGNPARGEYWAYGTYWEEAAFVGVLPLLLAVLALARWRRRRGNGRTANGGKDPAPKTDALRLAPFFVLLSLAAVLLALGNHTPIYPILFRYVPGFGLFQAPARLMIGYALGVSVLAGTGAQAATDIRITPRLRTALTVAILAGLGVALAGALAALALPGIHASFSGSMIRLGVTAALAAGLLLGRPAASGQSQTARLRLKRGQWQTAAAALIAADLLAFAWGLAPGADPAVYQAPVATDQFLQSQPPGRVAVLSPYAQEVYEQYVSLRSFGPADPAYLQGLRESLLPNLNASLHLPGVGNYDPLTLRLYHDLWDRAAANRDGPPEAALQGESQAALNLLGARYLVSDDDLPLPTIYDAGPRIYRNDTALPAAFVVSGARVIEDEETRLAALLDPAFDPRAEVLLTRSPSAALPRSDQEQAGLPQAEPSVSRPGPDQVVIQVEMAQPGYLVLIDSYYPGWQATADGQTAEILTADHAFRAVALEAGEHMVVLKYRPLSFRAGAWISGAAGLLLAVTLCAGLWRRRET